jgi:D-3-phosphoglycerate dehydrogenase
MNILGLKNKNLGEHKIAVTSKIFSNNKCLVSELQKYFDDVKINKYNDELANDTLTEFLKDCDGMILGTEKLDEKVIRSLSYMKYISKYGAGLSNVDFEALRRHNIKILYKKGVNSDSVAELVLGFVLDLIRRMDESVQSYRKGKWGKLPGKELSEITLGIIGYGHIGKVVAKKFAALGVRKLLINDFLEFSRETFCEFVSHEYLLAESDVVTIHIDAENRNYNFIDDTFINNMKSGAYLINTSRGSVVDEEALIKALKIGKIGGAALDVYKDEPEINKKLANCPNLLTTCHIAGSSNRAINIMGKAAIEGLLRLFNSDSV